MNERSLTNELLQEHQHTLAVINDLELRVIGNRSRPIDVADATDRGLLEDLIEMIDSDILNHYRFEEEILFPRLAEFGFRPITDMLISEHELVRSFADDVREAAVAALQVGFTAASWSDFRDGVMDLIPSATFHIQKEEMGVLRQVTMLLGTDADRDLAVLYADFV